MYELQCSECFNQFNNGIYLPRNLKCGHTICNQCLDNILEDSKRCPVESKYCPSFRCGIIMDDKKLDDYSVNYIALKIVYSKHELCLQYIKENFIQVYQEMVERCQQEHLELRSAVESLKNNIDLSLELINSNEEKLNLLSTMVVSDPSQRETQSKTKEVDESFDNICSQIPISNSPLIKDVSVQLEDFELAKDYLQEIHKVIMMERKMMAAVLNFKGVKKYAELSIRDDLLFIHSFERYQEKYHDVITVCFQDLRDILLRDGLADSVYGFLDLTYNENKFSRRVIIEPNRSNLGLLPQFLKLCTGELGISYKGLKYEQLYGEQVDTACARDSIITVNADTWNTKEVDCFSAFFLKKQKEEYINCSRNVIYVSLFENWLFDIFSLNNNRVYTNIIGTVIDLNKDTINKFKDASFRKIVDCGMAVKI